MKKVLLTSVAALTIFSAATPAFANNTFEQTSQKAKAKAQELGRKYAIALQKANDAKLDSEIAHSTLMDLQNQLVAVTASENAKVAAAQNAVAQAQAALDNAQATAADGKNAEGAGTSAADNVNVNAAKQALEDAQRDLATATENAKNTIAGVQAQVDKAQKAADAAAAALAAAVAEQEKAYNEAMAAGAQNLQEPVKPGTTPAKPATPAQNKVANNAPAKAAAKKLPNTSAVK